MMAQMSKQKQASGPQKGVPTTPSQAAACPGPLDDVLDTDLFKALCDPTRASLLACIAKCGRACTVSEVADCCDVDFSVVSRHLGVLERAGLLESQRAGRSVRYRVRYDDLCTRLRAIASAIESCTCNDACNC